MGCTQSQELGFELPKQFDVAVYTISIKHSIDKGDVENLLRVILSCSSYQRQKLSQNYSDSYNQLLLEHIRSNSSSHHWQPWVTFVLDLLLLPKHQSSVIYINKLLSNDPVREVALAQVLCSHSESDIQALIQCYKLTTGQDLVIQISCKCTAEVYETLSSFLASKDANLSPNECAGNLIQAAKNNNLFHGDCLFLSYLRTLPNSKLKDAFELFLRQCQRDLTVEIEKHYPPGSVQNTLMTVVGVIRNAPLQRVNTIHELLNNKDDDNCIEDLCYLLFSPTLNNLKEVKLLYEATYFEKLSMAIQSHIADDVLRKILLLAIK